MKTIHRRDFLKDSTKGIAAATAGLTLLSASPAKAAANERINLAVMGIRGRGKSLTLGFAGMKDAQVTYLCDVDSNLLPPLGEAVAAKQEGKKPRLIKDIREALDDRSVDAVVVATPDHWHSLATIWACQHEKHVYVEKPVSHNVFEGRKAVEAARKYNRVVQVGTQSRSVSHYHEAMAFIHTGKLGKVHMAKVWNSQLRANIGKKEDSATPAGVDYNLWLGPAPERPFNVNRFHYSWHWHWDYGTGDLGNDSVHFIDIARWGLRVNAPTTVLCGGGKSFFDDDQQTPDTQYGSFEFPEAQTVILYEQRLWSPYPQEGYENGVAFYGTEACMLIGHSGWKIIERGNKVMPKPSQSYADEPHRRNFLDCIKTGKRPNADIEEGHYSALICHLGNIATRVGRPLKFDAKTEQIIGDEEASKLLRREYRKPFEVPEKV